MMERYRQSWATSPVLESLSLSDNALSEEIPPRLGDLTNLEWLSLSHNRLSGEVPPGGG